ncbi:MAG: MFS transporter [Ruminococcaceae bacterium]|nr:MFS transporter [Oscillospiraceae bacterium]
MKTMLTAMKKSAPVWGAILLLVLIAVLYFNFGALGTGIFSPSVELTDPLNYYEKNGISCIINNSGLEIMVLEDGEYQYSIDGGCIDDGFYFARDVKLDAEGNIYVLDKQLNENGKDVDAERIIRYDADGNFSAILYSCAHPDGSSVLQLYNLTVTEESVHFVCTTPEDYFTVHTLFFENEELVITQPYEYEDIYEIAWDFAFDDAENVYISSKTGVIEKIDAESKKKTVLYDNDSTDEGYFSIPTNIEWAADGTIYFNDIGHRKIQKLHMDGTVETVVEIAEPFDEAPEAFNENPIYSGLFVGEDLSVATIYVQNYFIETQDGEGEQINEYKLYMKTADGSCLHNGSVFDKTASLFASGLLFFAVALIVAAAFVFIAVRVVMMIRKSGISGTVKTQIIIVFTAICVACISIYIIVSETNKVYYNEIMNNLENIAFLMARDIEEEDLENINTPADFMNESYQNISDSVLEVLNADLNNARGIYCVIYKAQNGIVSAIYADDAMYGSGYPMPGGFEGSAEQYIYETGETMTAASHSSAEGSFMLVLTPIFNEEDQVIGLMEVGTDLYSANEKSQKQVIDTILLVVTVVMVGVLLVSELIVIWSNMKKRRLAKDRSMPLDSALVRPIIFLFFFVSNMPTAFLPVYSRSLWSESFPIPMEVAIALPVSAELFIAAITSLVLGFAVSKLGVKLMSIAGAVLFAAGNLICALSPNLTMLIAASAITGIGDGLIILAVNSYIAGYENDEQKNNGFVHYNAALLSGVNCGTVIGSFIAERFGYSMTYFAGMVIALLLILFCVICIRNHKHTASEAAQASKPNVFQFMFKPNILKYFLLISAPYLICASFLNYFFPIFGEESGLTPSQISMAFLLMGVISIYFGPGLTKKLSEIMSPKKSMLLATALYALALLVFIIRPEISTCYLAVVLFAFADSFGFTSQSVYYATLPETVAIGEGPSMGINSGVESVSSTVGPLIFGFALMAGNVAGITMIAACFIGLAFLFVLTSFRIKKSGETK